MINILVSDAIKMDDSILINELPSACPMSWKVVDGTSKLTPYTTTNNNFAGVLYGQEGTQKVAIGEKSRVIFGGSFILPVTGAVTAGDLLYIDISDIDNPAYSATQPAEGYTEPVAKAYTDTAVAGYVKAVILYK